MAKVSLEGSAVFMADMATRSYPVIEVNQVGGLTQVNTIGNSNFTPHQSFEVKSVGNSNHHQSGDVNAIETNERDENVEMNSLENSEQEQSDTVDADLQLKDEKMDESTSPLAPYLVMQPRRIRCTECQRFTAETEEKMLRHVRKVHRGENPFQCYMCDYSTYNKVLFEEHVRIHQGIKPFKCAHCPYRSVSKKNTKKHEQIHRPDNPHKCDQCGFIARHLRSLQHHMATHDADSAELVECEDCKETFGNQAAYKNHKKSKKRCPECKDMFCQHTMAEHRYEMHGVTKKKRKDACIIKKSIFTCAICKWEGNSKPRILLHLIHHPNQTVDENVVDTHILREMGIMEPIHEIE